MWLKRIFDYFREVRDRKPTHSCPVCGYYCLNKYRDCIPPDEYFEYMERKESERTE